MLKYYETEEGKKEVIGAEFNGEKPNKNKILFKNEFAQTKKSLLIWSIIACFLMIVIVSIYPIIEQATAQMATMPELAEMFENIGYTNMTMSFYISLESIELWGALVGVFVCYLAVSLVIREIKNGSAEFLYTQAVDKKKILNQKLLVLLVNILIIDLAIALFTYITAIIVSGVGAINVLNYLLFTLGMIVLHCILGLICFSLSAIFKKKTSVGAGIGICLALYVVYFIALITSDLKAMLYFTPFGIISNYVLDNGFAQTNLITLGVWIVVAIGLFVCAKNKFKKDDII